MNKGVLSICVDNESVRDLLRMIGGPMRPSENRTTWLYRISEVSGLHYRVVRAIWHRERISQNTVIAIKQAARRNENFFKRAADELQEYVGILERTDHEFFSQEIDRLKSQIREIRHLAGETE